MWSRCREPTMTAVAAPASNLRIDLQCIDERSWWPDRRLQHCFIYVYRRILTPGRASDSVRIGRLTVSYSGHVHDSRLQRQLTGIVHNNRQTDTGRYFPVELVSRCSRRQHRHSLSLQSMENVERKPPSNKRCGRDGWHAMLGWVLLSAWR